MRKGGKGWRIIACSRLSLGILDATTRGVMAAWGCGKVVGFLQQHIKLRVLMLASLVQQMLKVGARFPSPSTACCPKFCGFAKQRRTAGAQEHLQGVDLQNLVTDTARLELTHQGAAGMLLAKHQGPRWLHLAEDAFSMGGRPVIVTEPQREHCRK